jgi:xanthine dehydrogenase small subunit
MALGAVLVLASGKGSREMPVEEFFSEYRRTDRRADELLVTVRIPLSVRGTRQMFRKVGLRQALAISRVSVACVAALESGVVTSCRIAAGSMSPTPLLLNDVCSAVTGRALNRELAEEAGRVADSLVSPRTAPEYRKETTGNLVRRFFTDILEENATV